MYSARLSLSELKSSPPSDGIVLYDSSIWTWAAGDFANQADDIDVVKSNSTALTSGAWTRDVTPVVSVLKFIPRELWSAIRKGTSVKPVATYVAQAYSAANVGAVYWPKGQYYIETEIATNGRKTFGDGSSSTRLVAATDNMRSVLYFNVGQGLIQDLFIEASRATAGIFCQGSNGSSIKRCQIENARLQGIAFASSGNQSEMLVENCLIRNVGKRISAGTGTASAGATSVTVSGADPSTLGIRVGYDFVKVGNNVAAEISAVSSNSISFYPGLASAVSGGTVTVLQGSGIEIQRNGDNSDIKTKNNEIQDCRLFGIDACGLYGVQSDGDTIESCGYAIGIGRRVGGGELQTINVSIRGLYSEGNSEGAAFYHGSSRELTIDNSVVDRIGNHGLDAIRIADPNTLRTVRFNIEGLTGPRRVERVNSTSTTLSPGIQAMFVQSAGASDFEVLLETPSAGNGKQLLPNFGIPIKIELSEIGGKTCFIRASDGSATNVNGVAGNVGVAVTGDYKLVTAYYSGGGWRVYNR